MSLKPVLSLRKPPVAANLDAFVSGAREPSVAMAPSMSPTEDVVVKASVETPPPSSSQVAKHRGRGLLERASGRTTRRMTIYVSPALAKRIVRFSAETEREISDVAAEALEKYLAANANG
jgi:hypothetical protein